MVRSIAGKNMCASRRTHAEWVYEALPSRWSTKSQSRSRRRVGATRTTRANAWKRADESWRGTIDRPVFKAPSFTALRAAVKSLHRHAARHGAHQDPPQTVPLARNARNGLGPLLPGAEVDLAERLPFSAALPRGALVDELDGLVQTPAGHANGCSKESKKVPIQRPFRPRPASPRSVRRRSSRSPSHRTALHVVPATAGWLLSRSSRTGRRIATASGSRTSSSR